MKCQYNNHMFRIFEMKVDSRYATMNANENRIFQTPLDGPVLYFMFKESQYQNAFDDAWLNNSQSYKINCLAIKPMFKTIKCKHTLTES